MRRSILFTLALAASFLFPGCSSSPLAVGGGTDTGNPGMLACAHAVFDEIEADARWKVEEYLPGGEEQLDPTAYFNERPALAKAVLASTAPVDTTVTIMGDSVVMRIRSWVDTVVQVDTLFLRDTLFDERIVRDTVHPPARADETIIIENLMTDTITIIDTVISRDTSMVQQRDTLFVSPEEPVKVGKQDGLLTFETSSAIVYMRALDVGKNSGWVVYQVHRGDSSERMDSIPLTPENFAVRTSAASLQMQRSSLVDGVVVFEAYTDGDGDGFLYKSLSTISPRSRFAGTYARGADTTRLSVLFDGGEDCLFPSTGNNRILTLNRTKAAGGVVRERVAYSGFLSADTGSLVVEFVPESGEAERISRVYLLTSGGAELDHRGMAVRSITTTMTCRAGKVKTLVVTVTPDTVLPWRSAGVSACIEYAKGKTGTFVGLVDEETGELSGRYYEGGPDGAPRAGGGEGVSYFRKSDKVIWETEP